MSRTTETTERAEPSSDQERVQNAIEQTTNIPHKPASGPARLWHTLRYDPKWSIAYIPLPFFVVAFVVVVLASYFDALASQIVVGFGLIMVIGGLLMWAGNSVPILRNFGLGTVLCAFLPAVLHFNGLFPGNIETVVSTFMDEQGFLDFFVSAVIVGSLLGMPRALLLKAGPRFLVPLLAVISGTFLAIGGISYLLGDGFIQGLLMFAAPIMGGGLGIGVVPMSQMYAEQTGGSVDDYMATMMSTVVLANVACIILAGILNGISKTKQQWFVGFNGQGELMRFKGNAKDFEARQLPPGTTYVAMFQGLFICALVYMLGATLSASIGLLHTYAWTILAAAAIKIFRLLPQELEDAAVHWRLFLNNTLLGPLLVAVSLTYIDIGEVVAALTSGKFILITLSAVTVSMLLGGFFGWLLKFYFIESSVVPGLAMADIGGSGDLAVLSAADRMHLMPFAALATRIGGTFTLLVATILVPFLN